MSCQQFKLETRPQGLLVKRSAGIIKSGKMAQVSSLSYLENEEKNK